MDSIASKMRQPGVAELRINQTMTRAEWNEVLAIGIIAPTSWLIRPYFSPAMPVWQLALSLSALLLAHSLVRDIAILLRGRRAASAELRREAHCFCLESSIGATGVVAGAILAALGPSTQVAIGRWEFALGVAATMVLAFVIKDLVISWNPLGLRREKDHLNLIVRWRNKSR
ncbi:MAG: hypothetical protein M3N91_08865 [Pseudomonadota bacterium]|nr:hypothetical protein [Pseudomonadota bacterium]